MTYRVNVQTVEGEARSVEYQSKCESRRFFSSCAMGARYVSAEWQKLDPERLVWVDVANMHHVAHFAPAQEAARNG